MADNITTHAGTVGVINSSIDSARRGYQDAIASATSGLDAILGANPSGSASAIRSAGTKVAGVADQMVPLAGQASALAGKMSDAGSSVVKTGDAMTQFGNDLIGMNRDSSYEAVRALLGLYDSYDPNSLVSLGVQDVQSQFEAGSAQQARELSRTGVNASSGRYAAFARQRQIALDTAKAAAATRLRQQGLDRQANALKTLVIDSAKDYLSGGVSAQAQGASVIANAIGAVKDAASILAQAGGLYGSVAALEEKASGIETDYAKTVAGQYNTISAVQKASAASDASYASTLLGYDASMMRGSSGGGVNVTKADSGTSKGVGWDSTTRTTTSDRNRGIAYRDQSGVGYDRNGNVRN